MPQEFQILRCCDCEKFQVHHIKKAKKWQCKVCGLKQSMKRAFFIGSSRDCRVNVQKLNFQAGENEMKKKLGESSTDVYDDNSSVEKRNEDFDFSTENEVDESDWIDANDGMDGNDWGDENDWVDENDGIDENDWIDENPSKILESENLQSECEDELPRKKQRCESYFESETVGENNFTGLNKDVEDQGDFSFSSIFKSKQDGTSRESIDSVNTISSTEIHKMESKQESDSFKHRKETSLNEVSKSKSSSILKPTLGFQLILNEAEKQRPHLSYDLDW